MTTKLDTKIYLRINSDKKDAFTTKAIAEYGTYARPLNKFIDAYTNDALLLNDDALAGLIVAVRSMHSFTNNVNQMAKKLNSKGTLDPAFTPTLFADMRKEINALKSAIRNAAICDSKELKKILDAQHG